uniref:Uncharacterized protein n=1 Tax=Sphaerodactylus townsendi TaxID=933632 RepID=A0ACB8GAK2_9SAUR
MSSSQTLDFPLWGSYIPFWSRSSEGWGWETTASVLIFLIWMEEMFKIIHEKVGVNCMVVNYWAVLRSPWLSPEWVFIFSVFAYRGVAGFSCWEISHQTRLGSLSC